MATSSNKTQSQQDIKEDTISVSAPPSNAFDEREFISKLLSEKRTLLTALHNEKKEKIKWKLEYEKKVEENEKFLRHTDVASHFTGSCKQLATLKLDDEFNGETKHLYRKLREKTEKLHEVEGKNERLLTQVAVLKSEVIRLASSLSRLDVVQPVDTEILREQLELYQQDFKKEKDDKVDAQERLSILSEQLRDNQEIIQNLTVELDMYKKAYEREKREKEKLLLKAHQPGNSSRNLSSTDNTASRRQQAPTKPHLQIVYPVTNDREQRDDIMRRRQLQQAGVLTRDIQISPTHSSLEPDGHVWWSS